jgi:diguanylate cyclase (GGDEF)-like protein
VTPTDTKRHRADPHRGSASVALAKTLAFAAVLCIVATAALLWIHPEPALAGVRLQWWAILAASVVAELMIFHIEFRREIYTFTLSEIPLVLGAYLASPVHLIVGRLVGELAVLVLHERQPIRKLAFNLATFYGECVALLIVFDLLSSTSVLSSPRAWGAGFVAILVADTLGFSSIALAVHWHSGQMVLRRVMVTGFATAAVNTCLGLLIAVLATTAPWACLLLAIVAFVLWLAYRGYSGLTQRYASLQLLYDFTRLVSGSKRADSVLESILAHARELLRAETAVIWLRSSDGKPVELRVTDREGLAATGTDAHIGLARAAQWFAVSRTAIVVPQGSRPSDMSAVAAELGAPDCIIAPITESSNVIGMIVLAGRLGEINTFDTDDGRLLETLAHHASVALENSRLLDQLDDQVRRREHEALHDSLTGLPNRVLFAQRVEAAINERPHERSGDDVVACLPAVALMDLDGFKEVNDTLGHHFGDRVLQQVAQRLADSVEASATVARLGGDEFAILLPTAPSASEVAALADRWREIVAQPMQLDGMSLEVGASVGIAVYPEHGPDCATLLQRADVAMYAAKGHPSGGVEVYSFESDLNTPRRLALANELRSAIDSDQLHVFYQPKARLSDGAVTGAEALLRWRHPDYGQVYPDEFIPLAEQTGTIGAIATFVLRTAVEQIAAWKRLGFDLGIAVNLSMRNLMDANLSGYIRDLLDETGVEAGCLTLEITETTIMSDATRVLDVLAEFRALGVRLSIDDFGTGYSSLSYLQKLPVDEVKIDKSFVLAMIDDPGAASIVRSVIDLAQNLGLEVVAEGVEDRRRWDQLVLLGCSTAQGYWLSRPVDAESFLTWLDTNRRALTINRS